MTRMNVAGMRVPTSLLLFCAFASFHKLVVKFLRFPVFLRRFDSVHGRSIELFQTTR